MLKSMKNMKINNENMYFASERKFYGILTIKLNGKNGKIAGKKENLLIKYVLLRVRERAQRASRNVFVF